MLNASTTPPSVVCTITVGTSPTSSPNNLAISPDGLKLYVESDGEASVTIVDLTTATTTTLSLPGVSAPITANIAISPDNKLVYVVSLPTVLTSGAVPNLNILDLTAASPAFASAVSVGSTPTTNPGIGVSFRYDSVNNSVPSAFITIDANTYVWSTTSNTITATVQTGGTTAVTGGTVEVEPLGTFAVVVDGAGNNQVANVPTATPTAAAVLSPTPQCSAGGLGGNTVAITPDGSSAYYSCPPNHFVQVIATSGNTVSATVSMPAGSNSHGLAIASDNSLAFVANGDGSVSTIAIPTTNTTTPATTSLGSASLGGLRLMPVKLSITPATSNVPTGTKFSFASNLRFPFSSKSVSWSVSCTAGGAACGTIDSTGNYTAPSVIPNSTVTVTATYPDIPNSTQTLFPATATVTVTPSQLVFTNSPLTVTAGACSTAITVQSQDSSNSPANPSSTETLALASGSTGGTFYSDNACATAISSTTIPTSANSATFFYKDTKAGAPAIMVTGSGSFAATASQSETVNPAAASNLVFTNTTLTVTAGVCSTGITVQSQDSLGNPSNPASAETLTLASSSTGATFYFDNACAIPITSTMIPTSANSSTFFYKDTKAGAPTVTVTGSGAFAATVTQSETVNAAAASKVVFTTSSVTVTAGVCSTGIMVQSQDSLGNPSNPASSEALALASSSTGATFYSNNTCTATITNTSIPTSVNSATFFYKDTKAGAPVITVTGSGAFAATVSQTETGSPAAASQLAFSQQPSTTTAGQAIAPAVTVQVQDQFGNVVTTDTSNVSMVISSGGVLSGASTTTVAAVAGVATFTNLVPTKAGTFTLSASDGALTGATSNNFTVNPAAASKLAFSQQPSTTTAGQAIAPAVTVQVQDQFGNVVTTDTSNVSMVISSGGVLSGASTTTVAAVAGVATFTNLVPTKTGTFTLSASDGSLTGATSNNFMVKPAPASKLVFTSQPASGGLGGNQRPLNPPPPPPGPVAVSVEDTFGNVVTTDASNVSMTISSGGAFSAGSTTTVAASGGVATFSNLFETIAGTFTLSVSDGSLMGATSNPFTLTSIITVTNTSTFTTVLIEDLPAGKDTFAATASNDPNVPSLGVTWIMISCSGSPVNTNNSTSCGQVAPNGAYTPPSKVPLAPANVFVAQATSVADPSKTATTGNINITSNITITFASPFTTVLIEDLPAGKDTFTATANNDPNVPSLSVTWIMLSCSGSPVNTNNSTLCGQVAPNGAYTPPSKVPLAPANTFTVQATANADPNKTAATNPFTITSSIRLTMASIAALIGANVDFTPKTTGGNVNLGTGANQSDLTLGVTLAITGTCIAPPNFSFSSSNPGCGSFNGSQTASPPTYSYTAPPVVPLSAATPAASLGQAQKAQIMVTAMSVADPNQPSASTTFVISSNISFAIPLGSDAQTMKNVCNPLVYSPTDTNFLSEITNDPCGFAAKTPAPSLAVGFPAAFTQSSAQNFGAVTGLTWVSTGGAIQPAAGNLSATFTAPSTVPNGGNITVTGYAIADFTKAATFSIPIVASKLIPHNIAPPFTLTVASGQSSGTIGLDFLGPTSGQISFACPSSGFVNLKNSTCAFSPNPSNAGGTTTVTMTLSVTRAVVIPSRPPRAPRTPLPGLPEALLAAILLMSLILAFGTRKWPRLHWVHMPRLNTAIVVFALCAVVLTWVAACNQFSQPGTPPVPVTPTQPATGFATVTGTPTTGSSPSTDSIAVPASVQ
jgi:hypothetical protein